MMKETVILTEYADAYTVVDYQLSTSEREYLIDSSTIHKNKPWEKRFFFDELTSGLRIKTQSWVGVIELEQIRFVIQPKFNHKFTSLMQMIAFANGIPYTYTQQTLADINHTNILEVLLHLFVNEAEKVIEMGFVKEYQHESDNLINMRGQIDFRKNLTRNFNIPTKVYCSYDELTTDIIENQLILTVLRKMSRLSTEPKLTQRMNKVRTEFELICSEYRGEHWPTLSYDRLNQYYEPVHLIGKYIWESLSAANFTGQKGFFYSLLIDMNQLFEDFTSQLLSMYLPEKYRVISGKRITDAVTYEGSSYRHIIPDIIVQDLDKQVSRVIDVKYKQYGKRKVDTNDIYQLAFYAQHYAYEQDKIYESLIVFPVYAADDTDMNGYTINLNKHSPYPGNLLMKPIDIEELLRQYQESNENYIKEIVLKLIRS